MKLKRFGNFLNESKGVSSLSEITPGSLVHYDGSPYYVIVSDDYTVELSKNPEALSGDRGNFLVNASMFMDRGFIGDRSDI